MQQMKLLDAIAKCNIPFCIKTHTATYCLSEQIGMHYQFPEFPWAARNQKEEYSKAPTQTAPATLNRLWLWTTEYAHHCKLILRKVPEITHEVAIRHSSQPTHH